MKVLNAEKTIGIETFFTKKKGIDIVKYFNEKYDFDIPVIFLT